MNFNLYISSIQKANDIAFYVSITVICLMAITFGALFYIYYHYYRKCIDNKLEDHYIEKEIYGEHKKYFTKTENLICDDSKSVDQKRSELVTLESEIARKTHRSNVLKWISNTVLIIIYCLFVTLMVFAIYIKSSGETFKFGKNSFLIIQTGSMETKNDNNSYLKDNNLNDQIMAYSLIGLEDVDNEKEIKLYDIYSYKDNEDNIIIHRLINITNENGTNYYTFRGDANPYSASYETKLTYDKILAHYTGYHSFGLGITVNYLRSNIGIITVSLALILILIYDIFDAYLGKRIKLRKEFMYPYFDRESLYAIKYNLKPVYVPLAYRDEVTFDNVKMLKPPFKKVNVELETPEVIIPPFDTSKVVEANYTEIKETNNDELDDELLEDDEFEIDESGKKVRKPVKPFRDKLAELPVELKEKYYIVQKHLFSYKLKSRVSISSDSYRLHKIKYAVFTITGKNRIKLHLKLQASDYLHTPIPVNDDSMKIKYQETPLLFIIKSDLSVKRACSLIDDMMKENNIPQKKENITNK